MSKVISEKFRNILQHPIVVKILDENSNITESIDEVLSWWDFDLYSRKPGPAYFEDGVFQGTDLDLICVLYELCKRKAVINISNYKSIKPATITSGQIITSNENRHGRLLGIISNKDNFTFSVKILDMNVMTSNNVGEVRNFALTQPSGAWYKEWNKISFLANRDENKFLLENNLLVDNCISFKYFVHPNRWISLFGEKYFITKVLIDRLRSDIKYYNQKISEMIKNKIVYPKDYSSSNFSFLSEETENKTKLEKGKSINVQCFACEIEVPSCFRKNRDYIIENNSQNLVELSNLSKKLTYNIIPKLSLMVRATEMAYSIYGQNKMPFWLKNVNWEEDVAPGKRTKYQRLILIQPKVGERGISIRKRHFVKKIIVSESFKL